MAVCHTAAAIVSRLADRADVWQTPIIGVNSMGYANPEKRLAAYRVHVNIPLRRHPIFFRLCPGNLPFSCHSGGMRAERRSSETSPKGPELLDMFRFGEQIAITAPKLIARSEQRSMTQ